jgi:hypothetical protein
MMMASGRQGQSQKHGKQKTSVVSKQASKQW